MHQVLISGFGFIALWFITACNHNSMEMTETLDSYFKAKSPAEAVSYFADDYQLHFGSDESPGLRKEQVIKMLGWDYALNPRHEIFSQTVEGNRIIVELLEQNDFSKALGFPGWRATSTYFFNDEGLIRKQVFKVHDETPDFNPFLEPIVTWAAEHHPERLQEVYDREKSQAIYTAESATKWLELIKLWEKSK